MSEPIDLNDLVTWTGEDGEHAGIVVSIVSPGEPGALAWIDPVNATGGHRVPVAELRPLTREEAP